MNEIVRQADFVRRISQSKEAFLIELEEYASQNNVPIIKAETARFLEVMCIMKMPARILEIGAAIGYSSMIMANALNKKVIVDTIEISKERVEIARENIKKYGFERNIRVIFGDGAEVLKALEKKYDLIFIDAAKGQYVEFLTECVRLLEDHGVIITDNVFCQGLLLKDNVVRRKRTMVRRLEEYIDLIMNKELKSSIISMGDGIAVSVKSRK